MFMNCARTRQGNIRMINSKTALRKQILKMVDVYYKNAFPKKRFIPGKTPIKTGGIFYKILSTPQMDWFLRNGLWGKSGFGWGRIGGKKKNWKWEFCRACHEIGKQRTEDCNVIYACAKKGFMKET
jgi:hypothetical protein